MKIRYFNFLLWRVIAGVWCLGLGRHALANPTGMAVASGAATTQTSGSRLTVTTSQTAVLNWQSFNIAAGETTIFNQPSACSVVVNNIHDANASQIYGSLQANGMVVLMNAAGFYFGPNSFVKTGGLIVSTANCLPPQNSGGSWEFNGPPPLASIVNYGQIQVGNGGSAFLIANNVENHGDIEAPGGAVGLASGQTVLLSERPDGRGMSMAVTLPQGSVNNYGTLTADAGTIEMNARVVNQNGLVQANSVQNVNGTIELVASDQLNLGANSQILARGDDSAYGSSGGSVTLQSGNNFSDDIGSQIDVSGGAQGGNGGNVEVSAPNILSLNSSVDAGAQTGWSGGVFALDPINIVLGNSGTTGPDSSGTIDGSGSGSGTLNVNVNLAFQNINVGQILLEASGNLTLNTGTIWDLSASTGLTSGLMTLEAGGNITFGSGASITDGNNWSVNLEAGVSFPSGMVQSGVGNIYLNGGGGLSYNGAIQTGQGSINLEAGNNILVGSGYVITSGGGSINAHALAGNIDTGSDAQGYHFVNNAGSLSAAYNLQNGLGGISTAAGGNVTLIAGGNVTSILPGKGVYYFDGNQESPDNGNDYLTAGSGAYGSQAGNVNIVAGGNVTGHYLVANGTGSIFAGVQMDANGNPVTDSSGNYVLGASGSAGTDLSYNGLALSLISGGWNVTAAQNILLQEVRNPNGVFNGGSSFNHYFNYAPGDYVDLSAGNLVQLGASVPLPRLSGANNSVPVIYPSILNITAGAGGVMLGAPGSPTSLVLFPSPQGSLTINTAGSLVSDLSSVQGAPQLFNLIVSDAGHSQYTTTANFGATDHATTPVHLNSPTPIALDIAGDLDLVNLVVPEAAQINVGGNMNNCGFQGMNLSSAPSFQVQVQEADGSTRTITVDPGVTSINVSGDINNRSAFTSIDLSQVPGAEVPDLSVLAQALNNSLSLSAVTLATSFYYDPATETLIYQNIPGVTLLNVLKLLNNLTVQEYVNGVPQWEDPPYDTTPLPAPNTVSVLGSPTTPGTIAYALLAQYNALGALPFNASSYGYTVGGGGQFDITARTIDLGTSAGIQSKGVALYTVHGSYPLAGLFGDGGVFDHGANINVTTTGNPSAGETASGDLIGDLDMYSTSIASLNGGNISISASGGVNAGSPVFTVNSASVLGIYSAGQGDVSVIANGDININGSRIAAYNGGNVTVESLHGNIDAGTGANGYVAVQDVYEDPVSQQVFTRTEAIPGSGVLATTFPPPLPGSTFPAQDNTVGNILVEAPEGDISAGLGGIIQAPLNGVDSPNATVEVLSGYELRDANGNRVLAKDIASGTAVPVFSAQNVVTLGSTIQVTPASSSLPVSLTRILDANGNPLLDASGHPLYVKTLDTTKQIVEFVNDSIQPYLNSGGNPVNVAEPLDAHSHPYPDAQGNPILVLGRSIDTGGSGVIAQNAVLKATGGIKGVIFSAHNIVLDSTGPIIVIALGRSIQATGPVGPTSELIAPTVNAPTADPTTIQSANGNGGGSTFAKGTTANATAQAASNNGANQSVASSDQGDDDKKKKKEEVALAQKVSRVTVILPDKSSPPNSSQKQTATQPL
jgi:filamentous hemagglutinin family protein